MEELAQEVAPEVDAPELPEVPEVPVDAPAVSEVAPEVEPAAPVKRPRGRPRKNPEEPKRPRGRPRKEVRFEEPEAAPVSEPSPIPDAMYVLAQVLLQNEAEARRRKAERYKNMLGL